MTENLKRKITSANLIRDLTQHCPDLNPRASERVIDFFLQGIAKALAQDKTVTLRRFGIFKPKVRPAYEARNPQTGQKIKVASKKLISFKPSNIFLKELNQEKGKKK